MQFMLSKFLQAKYMCQYEKNQESMYLLSRNFNVLFFSSSRPANGPYIARK